MIAKAFSRLLTLISNDDGHISSARVISFFIAYLYAYIVWNELPAEYLNHTKWLLVTILSLTHGKSAAGLWLSNQKGVKNGKS